MPVQIHEVVIRATVTERLPGCGDTASKSATPEGKVSASGGGSVEQIAEQIFDILKSKRER